MHPLVCWVVGIKFELATLIFFIAIFLPQFILVMCVDRTLVISVKTSPEYLAIARVKEKKRKGSLGQAACHF